MMDRKVNYGLLLKLVFIGVFATVVIITWIIKAAEKYAENRSERGLAPAGPLSYDQSTRV